MKKMINNSKMLIFIILFAIFSINFAFFDFGIKIAKAKDLNKEITTAKAMAVMEVNSGRILYSKNENEKLPMASTTKIITAIVAIENNEDLSKVISIEKDMTGIEGTSIYLKVGEELTIEDLLYGLMLRSGNDSAIAIAKATSGSVDSFVDLCNDFCEKIGALDTNLTNPHGLPDDRHYTTAKDLACISSYALKNEKFAKIVKTKQKTIQNHENNSKIRVLNNKNKLLKNMDNATGIKTGFTKKAGRCFVGSAKQDDMEVVCVLLNCVPMFEDCQRLIEKSFSEFKMVEVVKGNEVIGETKVIDGEKDNVKLSCNASVKVPLKVDEVDKVEVVYNYPKELPAPLSTTDYVGDFNIYVSNHLIFSDKIYIIENVNIKKQNYGGEIVKDFVHLD